MLVAISDLAPNKVAIPGLHSTSGDAMQDAKRAIQRALAVHDVLQMADTITTDCASSASNWSSARPSTRGRGVLKAVAPQTHRARILLLRLRRHNLQQLNAMLPRFGEEACLIVAARPGA